MSHMYAAPAWMQEIARVTAPVDTSAPLTVRLLREGEGLPPNLPHGIPGLKPPQPDWVWLVCRGEEPVAMLIAAPAQNLAFLMRICVAANELGESTAALMLLFRTAFAEMLKRGYHGYVTMFSRNWPETRLFAISNKLAGEHGFMVDNMTMAMGPTDLKGL